MEMVSVPAVTTAATAAASLSATETALAPSSETALMAAVYYSYGIVTSDCSNGVVVVRGVTR